MNSTKVEWPRSPKIETDRTHLGCDVLRVRYITEAGTLCELIRLRSEEPQCPSQVATFK